MSPRLVIPAAVSVNATLGRRAPEVLAQEHVDEKVDMWAMGVVMWVLLTGRHPFDSNFDLSEEELTRRVIHEDPDFKVRYMRSKYVADGGGFVGPSCVEAACDCGTDTGAFSAWKLSRFTSSSSFSLNGF